MATAFIRGPYLSPTSLDIVWTLAADETGDAYHDLIWKRIQFQFSGNASGADLVLEGSLDGETYFHLHATKQISADHKGVDLNLAMLWSNVDSDGLYELLQEPRYIRPRVTGGDENTSLTCILFCRRR